MSNIAAGIALFAAAAGSYLAANATAIIIAAATIATTTAYQRKRQRQLQDFKPKADVMVRSAVEPCRIVYGEARISGPICYVNTRPAPGSDDNSELWHLIALCSHEVEDITDVWFDGDEIPNATINWGTDGSISSGKYATPAGKVKLYKQLGTPTQTAQSELAAAFTDWTTNHRLRSVATLTTYFEIGTKSSQGLWANGAPQNMAAVVRGKKVYDPRLDGTQSFGTGTHRVDDDTTWEWSDNPALCLADYLIDDRLGIGSEGVTADDVDYAAVADAADVCDTLVEIPPETSPATTEKRYTCNGVLFTTESYQENVEALLSSMNGALRWTNGQFVMRASDYVAPSFSFTEDNVIGNVEVEPERPRDQRFNTVRGTFIDPEQKWVRTEFLRVLDSSIKTSRDNGQALVTNIDLPMTTGEYEAQRIGFQLIALNNQQTRAIVRLDWSAMRVAPGDRIELTVDDLSWSSKVFLVEQMRESPGEGFELQVREDSSSAYDDPPVGEYSVRTASGVVDFGDMQVPVPSGLTATSVENGVLLQWQAPRPTSAYDEIYLYASPDSSWANAVEIWSGRATSYLHELDPGVTRYYWTRADNESGEESLRDPDSDTSTITATAGAVEWPSVGNTGGTKPDDNADVTADNSQPPTWLTDLIDADNIDAAEIEAILNALNLLNAPAEAGADVTSSNGQPPSWLTALIDSGDINATSVEAVLNALNLLNGPSEANADVTSANGQPPSWLTALVASGDIDASDVETVLNALNMVNGPAEGSATQGLIDVSGASTDGEFVVDGTAGVFETVQTDTISLGATTTILLTITANYRRNGSNSQSQCEVRVTQNGTEIGGLSSATFRLPGNQAYDSFVFRRRLTLSSGSYTFDLDFARVSSGGNIGVRNREITIEEVR